MSDIRLDRINNQYVLIAPERLRRPNMSKINTLDTQDSICPFCNGNEKLTPHEIYAIRDNGVNMSGWKTRVIPNLYKAVQIELEDKSRRDSMFESIPGFGAHEILIDSPCHDCGIEELLPQNIENWLRTIIIRIEDLKKDKRLIYLSIFKNFGIMAGASQVHPHTQILALPVMPQNELIFLDRNMRYYRRHGRGMIEDILQSEISAKERIISEVGNFVAFCPYASSFPFEVIIAPINNLMSLEKCSREDVNFLAILIKEIFQKLSYQLGNFEYNLYFRLAPIGVNYENELYMSSMEKNYRFTIRIVPRIYTLGGFEISTGMAINPVSPEECAKLLNMRDFS